jgi:GST-like protein
MADLSRFPITSRWPAEHPDRLQLYSAPTPNGVKVSIMLEEIGLAYEPHFIAIGENETWTSEYLSLNPNGKIPAIVDPDGPDGEPMGLFESGAILIYLAEKTGRFLSKEPVQKYKTLEWLMWQMGGVGPMFGQAHHFLRAAPTKIEYGIKRYVDEAKRLYGVLDKQLAGNAFAAGSDYTIADMAIFPWAARHEWHTVNLADFPNVKRWYDIINARPAVTKGMAVPYLN